MKAQALPQKIIDAMSPEDRAALEIKSTTERDGAVRAKTEAAIQKQVEAYCAMRGFVKVTPENIERAKANPETFPPAGWQYHLSPHGAKKNPMLPDITLFDRARRFLWLELKTASGKPARSQAGIIAAGWWLIAYSAEEAVEIIKEWIGE